MTEVEPNPAERLLTVLVDSAALEAAKSRAARRLSREIKIKGFRPGKAPQRVVESMVGPETMRKEAVDEALPQAVTDAVREAGLEPAVTPRVTAVRDTAEGFEADVRVTLWPEITVLPEYRGRRIVVDSPVVKDGDVDAQIERMRLRFAELDDVDRPGADGDFSLIDVRTTSGGGEVAAGSATDLLVEVGAEAFLEGLGEALRGQKAGDILEFPTSLPRGMGEEGGQAVDARVLVKQVKARRLPELNDAWVDEVSEFSTVAEMREALGGELRRLRMGEEGGQAVDARVLVKQVKARRLPELTDAWVDEVSEFSTVAEMREALGGELRRLRMGAARMEMEERLLDQMREEVDLKLPADLIEAEADAVLHRFAHRLEARKATIEQYLAATGQSAEMLVADARTQAVLNLRTRLLLEAVARAEAIEVSDEDLAAAVDALAQEARVAPAEYRQALAEGGGEKALAGDILRRRAIDRLLELAVAVDAEGQQIEFPAPGAGAVASTREGEADESDEPEPAEVES